ncbi:hypothetical protein EMPS_04358 [Entomortierella parvispora]|uniref:Glycoside hydrolase family 5 domain-containing protein n=1 Tax=Entomortierella parvispora TaxID=205924 RepID=A0A9P3H8I5_9FUNG|nr:hypothetical protein EMPS_04358 [Entomortierella parvispora]
MSRQPDLTSSFGNAWESAKLAAKDGWILDPQNRVVILHGINLSGGSKMPFLSASEAAAAVADASSFSSSPTGDSIQQQPAYFGATPTPTPLAAASNKTKKEQQKEEEIRIMNKGEVPGVMYAYKVEHFFDHRQVSFVNRPFTLEQADLHFERLARWGCQCLRVLVPWEALEHAGPGIYDEDYIEYLIKLLKIAGKYGLKCFLDPHVDCWSRFTGGSGMPGWTLELVGLEMTKFEPTEAATVQNTSKDKEDYPKMIWATNSFKVAAATMYTLFFSGQIFAPKAMVPLSTVTLAYLRRIHSTVVADEAYRRGVEGGVKAPSPVQHLIPIPRADHSFVEAGQVNIQHFLQGHFIEAFCHLVKRIREDDAKVIAAAEATGNRRGSGADMIGLLASGTVMGLDSINEPSPGYLNHPDLNKLVELADLQIGTCPTPIQGLELAQGRTVECEVWKTGGLGPMKTGSAKVNPDNINLWKRPYWKTRQQVDQDGVNNGTLHPPSAPTMPDSSSARDTHMFFPSVRSPFDMVSSLDISSAKTAIANTLGLMESGNGKGLSAQALTEAHLPKTGWPAPSGYSDLCLWADHKVWDPQTGKLLKPNYFERIPTQGVQVAIGYQPGKEVEWKEDFWLPFVNTFSLRLRQEEPRLTMFVEPPINEAPPIFKLEKVLIGGTGDHLMNMIRALVHWKPLDRFRNQHTLTTFSRRSASANMTTAAVTESEGTPNADTTGNKGKGLSTRRIEDDLHDNACQNPSFDPVGDVSENIVVAPHFYDGYTNVTRDFVPFTLDYLGYKRGIYWSVLGALKFGWSGVGLAWKDQVQGIQSDIRFAMGHQHGILMGETGVPMDMHDKASFKHRYGSPKQVFAMQLMLDAMDSSMLSFTLWNYCADNSNQWGDRWNGEDFSVWCPPENDFLEPDFPLSSLSGSKTGSGILARRGNSRNEMNDVTLTEISTEIGTGKEVAGCHEGLIWWCCLPGNFVWTRRTAPKRLVVISVDPVTEPPSAYNAGMAASSSNPTSIASANTAGTGSPLTGKSAVGPAPATLDSWQDILPLSLQIERSRPEFYSGLRVTETFIRAYPLAIWGEPLMYKFEPGKPLSGSSLSSPRFKARTNDVASWGNRFVMFFKLECNRRPSRDGHCKPQQNEISTAPPTDVFLPRFHFSLDSPSGVDQFESLRYVQEVNEGRMSTHSASLPSSLSPTLRTQSQKDKGRWHRLDIKISDGHFTLTPDRQLLQVWTTPNISLKTTMTDNGRAIAYNPQDNLASTASLFEAAETRIKNLFDEGWDGQLGITTESEKDWIRRLWAEMQKGLAEAESFVRPSIFSCFWSTPSEDDVAVEEKKRLKLKELQQRWRDRVGLPVKGAAFCQQCGQLEVMHLHGIEAQLSMWSGYRG